MYDLSQKYWAEEISRLEKEIKHATQQEAQKLSRKLEWMKGTEMAVIISQEQNEIRTFQKCGLDIKTHRHKMEKREPDKEFKDPANPLRVVFVCAIWLTGFDVKCLSCLYLDKPLKAHTLMQTTARANRAAEGKRSDLIVKALRKVLADYTANVGRQSGTDPSGRNCRSVMMRSAFLGIFKKSMNMCIYVIPMWLNSHKSTAICPLLGNKNLVLEMR